MRHPLRNRSLAASLAFAALAALAACSDAGVSPTGPDAKKQPKPTPPPADTTTTTVRPFYAGAYLGDANSTPQTIAAAIRGFGTLTGKQPALVKTFHSLNCDFTSAGWCGQVLRAAASTGATNYVALDLKWTGAPSGGVLDAIVAGQADARLAAVAQGIRSVGSLVMLEPGWEMNGNWSYAWQGVLNGNDAGAPAKYAAAWRHVVDVFRAQGADNVRWVFDSHAVDRVPVVSTGVAARILLLGALPLEFYYAKPFQRPREGAVFGFLITPGW